MAMKVYKDGMTLMRDTASLANALMENKTREVKVGDTFAVLMWTDRELRIVTAVEGDAAFTSEMVETKMENWYEGTEYPVRGEDGAIKTAGDVERYVLKRGKWRDRSGNVVHLSWGATTGYRDPSF